MHPVLTNYQKKKKKIENKNFEKIHLINYTIYFFYLNIRTKDILFSFKEYTIAS